METPTVSVLMPTCNRARYLQAAIDSVLAQSFQDFELIVIDDGSTDDTDRILSALSDPRVRILRQEHRGQGPALNAGLKAACGAYVARNDSDDVWLPELLDTLVPVLERHPEIGFVYARAQEMTADGMPAPSMRGFPLREPTDTLGSLLYADYTCAITTIFRRAVIDRAGWYDTTMEWHSDWDMVLRVALHGDGLFVDRLVASFRTHDSNITAVHGERMSKREQMRVAVLDKFFRRPDLPSHIKGIGPVAYRNVYINSGLQWLGQRRYRPAVDAFLRALDAGPNPIATLGRIVWTMFTWFGLSRTSWTARATYRVLRALRPGRKR